MSPAPDVNRSWPRPVVTLAACAESALPWLAWLLIGLALLAGLVRHLQQAELDHLRDARLSITLQELKDRLEADLALGFDLADSARAQGLLEDALAHDRTLLAAEVFDPRGLSLFNTDRGAVGEQVPAAWLAAAGPRWTVSSASGTSLGMALRGPFGEVAGQVCVTATPPPALALAPLLWAMAVCAVALGAAVMALTWQMLVRQLQAADPAPMDAAAQTLSDTAARLQQTLGLLLDEDPRR